MRFFHIFFLSLLVLCAGSCSKKKQDPAQEDSTYFATLPTMSLSYGGVPCFDIKIEGETFRMELDLGHEGALTLCPESIDQITNKSECGIKTFYDVKGNQYKNRAYSLSEIKMEGITMNGEILLEEDHESFVQNTAMTDDKPSRSADGRLGWQLFANGILVLDPGQTAISIADGWATLEENGYDKTAFVSTPLFLDRGFVEFDIQIEKKPLRCVLDTAASINVFHCPLKEGQSREDKYDPTKETTYSSAIINGYEAGPIAFYPYPISFPMHIEAILGIHFIKKHITIIDFPNKQIYFSHLPIK